MQLQFVDGTDPAGKSDPARLRCLAQPFGHNWENGRSCRFNNTKSDFELPCCKVM